MTLQQLLDLFQSRYYLPDPAPLELALGTVVATRMPLHQPVWVLLVGPPSSGKTAIFDAFAGQKDDVRVVSNLTMAGLLSGSNSRSSTGGLLPSLGKRGVLCLKDVTSLLSLPADTRNGVFGALREIHDGRYARELGTGRRSWSGKLGLLGGVTEQIDRHLADIGSMGERMVHYRMRVQDESARLAMGAIAARNAHHETDVRAELIAGIDTFLAGLALPDLVIALGVHDQAWLGKLADLATRLRTPVTRDWKERLVLVPEPEATPRLIGMCFALWKGLEACGVPDDECRRLVAECAIGSVQKIRRQIVDLLMSKEKPSWSCQELGYRLGVDHTTIRHFVEELAALHIVAASPPSYDPVRPSDWLQARWDSCTVAELVSPLVAFPPKGTLW